MKRAAHFHFMMRPHLTEREHTLELYDDAGVLTILESVELAIRRVWRAFR